MSQNNRKFLQQQQISNQMQKKQLLNHKNYEIPLTSLDHMPIVSNSNDTSRRKYHSYVNVDFIPNKLSNNTLSGSVKEIQKTNRQDFLSSQPGGFVL